MSTHPDRIAPNSLQHILLSCLKCVPLYGAFHACISNIADIYLFLNCTLCPRVRFHVNWVGATIRSLTPYTRFKCTNQTQSAFIFANQGVKRTIYQFGLTFRRIFISIRFIDDCTPMCACADWFSFLLVTRSGLIIKVLSLISSRNSQFYRHA